MGQRFGWTCLAALAIAPCVLPAQEASPRLARAVPAGVKPSLPPDDDLYAWRTAVREFQAVAPLIVDNKFDQVAQRMKVLRTTLREPYATWAHWRVEQFSRLHDEQQREPALVTEFGHNFWMAFSCNRMGARTEAVVLLRKAFNMRPSKVEEWDRVRELLRYFPLTADELAEFEPLIGTPAAKTVCQAMRREPRDPKSIYDFHQSSSFDEMIPLGGLDKLHQTLTPQTSDAERREVYEITIAVLGISIPERDAWRSKLLVDLKNNSEACAKVLFERGSDAVAQKQVALALVDLHKICDEYKMSSSYRQARLLLSGVLFEQRQLDDAIKSYQMLILTDEEYQKRIEQRRRSDWYIEHSAARGLSQCYQAKEDHAQALKWFDLADTRYPWGSFCGTCQDSINFHDAVQRAKLLAKTGQVANAIKTLDGLMFQPTDFSGSVADDDTARLYVDLHNQRDELTSLALKLRVNKQNNLLEHQERIREHPNYKHDKDFDGNTPSMKVALAYLTQLKAKSKAAAVGNIAPAVDDGPSILDLDQRAKGK